MVNHTHPGILNYSDLKAQEREVQYLDISSILVEISLDDLNYLPKSDLLHTAGLASSIFQ